MARRSLKVIPTETLAIGGALEGADRFTRETALWQPSMRSPDQVINSVKPSADARGRDSARNTGFVSGAVALHKDSVIGAQYRLNARPVWRYLQQYSKAFDETWAEEFQQFVEAWFNLLGESEACWLDAQRVNTFTAMNRMVIGVFLMTGETLATAEWIKESQRPCMTAIQMVSPDRLCNPLGVCDTRYLRRGIEKNIQGRPLAYNIRLGDALDPYPDDFSYTWRRVPIAKPWGRIQVIHIIEQQLPDQSRGISDMVAALKNMHMTKRFQEVTLQNAVIQATYAAAIESELPAEAVSAALGSQQGTVADNMNNLYGAFMTTLGAYLGSANNVRVDGAQIPHLFPGTKLTMQPAKTTGGVGTSFEESLMRHTSAALGLSYEEFSRDFSKTNYSSGRAAMGVSAKFMAARKKHVADKFSNHVYSLALEELFAGGTVPLPRGIKRDIFYAPLAKESICNASWIGSGAGQIDELKETQAAMLRIASGLSTWESEAARLGKDWREIFEQRNREEGVLKKYGLTFDLSAKKPLGVGDTSTTVDPNVTSGDTAPPTSGGGA